MIGMRYSTDVLQDRKQRNDIAGKEKSDEPGSDAYAQCPGCLRQSAIREKIRDHPALEEKFEHEESDGYGNQPGLEATKKSDSDGLPPAP